MGDKRERELEKERQRDADAPLFCHGCGCGITWTHVTCQEGYCDICFEDQFGDEFNDTLEDPIPLVDPTKPKPPKRSEYIIPPAYFPEDDENQ